VMANPGIKDILGDYATESDHCANRAVALQRR